LFSGVILVTECEYIFKENFQPTMWGIMDSLKTRELLVSLVMDLRAADMRARVYRALLETIELETIEVDAEIPANWRIIAENVIGQTATEEHLAARVQPLIDYALCGLSQADAQALLDRVKRRRDDIQ
jgi:hypothetical protein